MSKTPRCAPVRVAILLAAVTLLQLAPARAAVDTSKFKEVDFTGLTDAQKRIAIKIMESEPCNCGCQLTIAECRDKDASCRRSLIFSRTVIDALREGKNEAETIKVLRAKASTFVEARMPDDSGVIYDIKAADSPIRGPRDAPITVVEFSDFQCPYCASLQETLDLVLKAFPKEVRLVYKQYPLNIHQYARQAAAASLAAHSQGKFWQMHDKLFENFRSINEENIKRWAREIGLNMAEFEKAMQSGRYEPVIQKDMTDGAAAKVIGTPTVFVNGRRAQERSFEAFKKMILDELAALKAAGFPAAAAKASPGSGQ
jgi:protein-disulfide isomerase